MASAVKPKLFAVFRARVPGRRIALRDGTRSDRTTTQVVWVAVPLDDQWQYAEERPADIVTGHGIWPAENREDAIKQAREATKAKGGKRR